MAKGMTLQEAIARAPDWATHISVSKFNGEPEFYNKFTKDGWYSSSVAWGRVDKPEMVKNTILSRELVDGTSPNWYLEDIAFSSLEND